MSFEINNYQDHTANWVSEYNSNILETLYLDFFFVRVPEPLTMCFSKNLKNLTHLSCRKCILHDMDIQNICKNYKQLKHIAITAAAVHGLAIGLTDFGFTGLKYSGDDSGCSISSLEHLKFLHIEVDCCELGEKTVDHILKIKKLEYLYITCNKEKLGVSVGV